MRKFFRRLFCHHLLAWYRNIYGDEINHTGCRTVFICEKCHKHVYIRDYITEDMAIVVWKEP